MKRSDSFRKIGALSSAFCAVFFHFQLKCVGSPLSQQQEQQQSQQPPPPPPTPTQNSQPASQQTPPTDQPAAKHKKVWTEEDVILLRTPADAYQVEKEAKEAAEAAAAAKEAAVQAAAKSGKQPPLDIKLPATVEETQKLIKTKEEQINDEQSALERLIQDLPTTPEDQKAEIQKEIDRVAGDLPRVRSELNALQGHLEKLTKAQLNEAPPPPAAPPSQ